MKHLKKLGSVLLALVMVMALMAPAFAADLDPVDPGMTNNDPDFNVAETNPIGNEDTTRGKITITNAVVGETYSIYRIFDLKSYNRTNGAYLYKVNEEWKTFFEDPNGPGLAYVTIDGDYVSWKLDEEGGGGSATEVQEFAKLALAYAKENGIEKVEEKLADAPDAEPNATTVSLVFDDLDLGYYLVDSSMGALCNLNTTDSDVEIKEKNQEPTNVKEVQEDSRETDADLQNGWGDKNDADIGQTVNFRSTITVGDGGAVNYVFHDKMSPGLTFSGTVAVTLNGTPVENKSNTSYELKDHTRDGATSPEDECTFEVEFSDDFCKSLEAGDEIVISYTAVVNEKANIGGDMGNENESKLTYGEGSSTVPSKTTTYTWVMVIEKVDGGGNKLAGASFTLHRAVQNTNGNLVSSGESIVFVKPNENVEAYRVATDAEKNDDNIKKYTEITTDDSGEFKLEGLDADVYLLTETKAPDGYNKLDGPVAILIMGTDAPVSAVEGQDPVSDVGKVFTITYDADKNADTTPANPVSVLNLSGTRLPSTGGIGTTIFYIVGGVLVVGAVVLLITKRRASVDDE